MDQQVGIILFPIAIVVSPIVGAYLGVRRRSLLRSFLVGWGSTILTGTILGAIVAAIVDSVAALGPGGNPWIGHVEGISIVDCLLGATLIGGVSVFSGLVAGFLALAGCLRRARK